MKDNKTGCNCPNVVGCDVKNCKYHNASNNTCAAERINVENKTAINKAETYCGTFSAKTDF